MLRARESMCTQRDKHHTQRCLCEFLIQKHWICFQSTVTLRPNIFVGSHCGSDVDPVKIVEYLFHVFEKNVYNCIKNNFKVSYFKVVIFKCCLLRSLPVVF